MQSVKPLYRQIPPGADFSASPVGATRMDILSKTLFASIYSGRLSGHLVKGPGQRQN